MRRKRAAIYLRCSTGRQDVGMQERELRQYAARRGWGVNRITVAALTDTCLFALPLLICERFGTDGQIFT
jgi:hypothetical protein